MALKLGSNLDMGKVVKSLGQKMILVPHIDMAIGEGDFEWEFEYSPKQTDDAWHPSGDCTPSLRELYLKATGQLEERAFSPGLYKIFMTGHFWHQYLQWVVEKKLGFAGPGDIERRGLRRWDIPGRDIRGYFPEREANVICQPYRWATGSADIAPCRIPEHGEYLVDFKTVNPRMFVSGMSPDYLAKWECQGNVYMDFFDIEQALFVLIDKSNGDMKEMVFTRNQPLIDAIYTKWEIVGACLDESIEPPEDEDILLPLTGPVAT